MSTKKAAPVVKLSASSLGLLRGPAPCPRCFWRHMNGDKRPESPFPSITTGLDAALKRHIDNHRISQGVPYKLIPVPGEQRLWGTVADIKELRGWVSTTLETPHGPCELRGKLDDLLIGNDGKFSPLDQKSKGSRPKDAGAVYYRHQLDIYALLLERNGKPTSGTGYLWYWWPTDYINDEGFAGMGFDSEIFALDTDVKRALALVDEGMRILGGPCPAPVENEPCQWCRYHTGGKV